MVAILSRPQYVNSSGIDLVLQEYTDLSTRRINWTLYSTIDELPKPTMVRLPFKICIRRMICSLCSDTYMHDGRNMICIKLCLRLYWPCHSIFNPNFGSKASSRRESTHNSFANINILMLRLSLRSQEMLIWTDNLVWLRKALVGFRAFSVGRESV